MTDRSTSLAATHTPAAIQERLESGLGGRYLRDFVFGAIDGAVTTFAVVSGVEGARLAPSVALILGCANLLADGFSMAASNFLGTRTEAHLLERTRRMEERHIDEIPSGEREEVRQIYAAKGFSGDLLDQIVAVITKDRAQWIDTMLVEEHGLALQPPSAVRAATATFLAFCIAGAVPLLPLLVPSLDHAAVFPLAALGTGVVFALVGWAKGRVLGRSTWLSALETLALGSLAAALAYGVGALLRNVAS